MKLRKALCYVIISLCILSLIGYILWKFIGNRYSEDDLFDNLVAGNLTFGDYIYDEYDDHTIIVSYTGNDSLIHIPEEIDGKTVQCIADSAFYGDEFISCVYFNEGLLRIGHQAFIGCSGLREIYMSSTVVDIGMASFWGCDIDVVHCENNPVAEEMLTEYGVISDSD